MTQPRTAPYGSWKSPITSELIVAESIGLGDIALDGDDIYWVESRPSEGGRRVIVRRRPDRQTADITPRPFNVRTRVHEYGGGDFTVSDGIIYFANFDDQRLYRQEGDGPPQPITPAADPEGGLRYADMVVDQLRGRLIAVREDHTVPGTEPVNALVSLPGIGLPGVGLPGVGLPGVGLPGIGLPGIGLPGVGLPGVGLPGIGLPGVGLPGVGLPGVGLPGVGLPGAGLAGTGLRRRGEPEGGGQGGQGHQAHQGASGLAGGGSIAAEAQVLVSGSDFYAAPRLSPDGSTLAWLAWNHPNMPWEGTELWTAAVAPDGSLVPGTGEMVAGGTSESIGQPEWSPDGILYFVSDRTGWWNLYRFRNGAVEPVTPPLALEFGKPHWVFGSATYGFASAQCIICAYADLGAWQLAELDTTTGQLSPILVPYTEMGRTGLRVAAGQAVFGAGSPTEPLSMLRLDLSVDPVGGSLEILQKAGAVTVDSGYLSAPVSVEFPTEDGLTAYAFYYPPQNRDYTALAGERPPLLVKSHGGPTASASTALNLQLQYWTSRGIAVLDVNYGGSTGYGRAYRDRLRGRWGIVDVDDCVNGARHLVAQGQVDDQRLAIDGGSAGGYTTLAALTFRDVFRAGASHYGVSDLEALAQDTHKFESRYLDGLVGPYPERQDLYRERSPINFTDQLSCPLIFFQGLEDKIVPPSQAELMFDAVRRKGLPTAYILFEGEQHGFRRAENIRRSLDAELYFYSRVFGFALADPVEPVAIENL